MKNITKKEFFLRLLKVTVFLIAGIVISVLTSMILIIKVSGITLSIFLKFYPVAIELFVRSGRFGIVFYGYLYMTMVAYFILYGVIVFEYLNKHKKEGIKKSYGDKLKDLKDQILFNKPDNHI